VSNRCVHWIGVHFARRLFQHALTSLVNRTLYIIRKWLDNRLLNVWHIVRHRSDRVHLDKLMR